MQRDNTKGCSATDWCKFGAQCRFAKTHPAACRFGAGCRSPNCRFLHPNAKCSYDTNCTNRQCQLRHSGNDASLGATSAAVNSAPPSADCHQAKERKFCRFGQQCKYAASHPPPCKYDKGCKSAVCICLHSVDFCDFGSDCTRPHCDLRHVSNGSSLWNSSSSVSSASTGPERRACRFGASCRQRHSCQYSHPDDPIPEPTPRGISDSTAFAPRQGLQVPHLPPFFSSLSRPIARAFYDFNRILRETKTQLHRYTDRRNQFSPQDSACLRARVAELDASGALILRFLQRLVNARTPHKNHIFAIYRELYRLCKNPLPLLPWRQKLEEVFASPSAFYLVDAGPAAGIATQLVQYISDSPQFFGKKILCLQPTAASAVVLTDRVALEYAAGNEKLSRLSSIVGDLAHVKPFTRVVFMAEADFIRLFLLSNNNEELIQQIGAVVVDSASDRRASTDFILDSLARLVPTRWGSMKGIIATRSDDGRRKLSKVFAGAPSLSLAGATSSQAFQVNLIYRPPPRPDAIVSQAIRIVANICRSTPASSGDILALLPGPPEVEECNLIVTALIRSGGIFAGDVASFGLHQLSPVSETLRLSRLVCSVPAENERRVIFTSLEISELEAILPLARQKFVVLDSGLVRDELFDPKTRAVISKVIPISKERAQQRAGLAGLISPGVCYRLYSHDALEQEFRDKTSPEVIRRSFERSFVTALAAGLDPSAIARLDAPNPIALEMARSNLTLHGAITPQGQLTAFGRFMAETQLDLPTARVVFLAHQQGIGQDGLMLAAILSVSEWAKLASDANSADKRPGSEKIGDVAPLVPLFEQWSQFDAIEGEWDRLGAALPVGQSLLRELANQDRPEQAAVIPDVNMSDSDEEYDDMEVDSLSDSTLRPGEDSLSQLDALSESGDIDTTASLKASTTSMGASRAGGPTASPTTDRTVSRVAWAQTNQIHPRAFYLASHLLSSLRRAVAASSAWESFHIEQRNPASPSDLAQLLAHGFVHHLAYRVPSSAPGHDSAQFLPLFYPAIPPVALHFASAVLPASAGPLAVVQTLGRLPRAVLINATPVDSKWLLDHPQYAALAARVEEVQKKAQAEQSQVLSLRLPTSLLQAFSSKAAPSLEVLAKQLGCIDIQANTATNSLVVACRATDEARIRQELDRRIEELKHTAQDQLLEEPYLGSLRVVWSQGLKIAQFLGPSQFITLSISELPAGETTAHLRELGGQFGPLSAASVTPVLDVPAKSQHHPSQHFGASNSSAGSATPTKAPQIKSTAGTLTFASPAAAARCLEHLRQQNPPIRTIPVGIQSNAANTRKITGCVVSSFANGTSAKQARLIYSSAADANAVIKAKLFSRHRITARIYGLLPGKVKRLKDEGKYRDDPRVILLNAQGLIPIQNDDPVEPAVAAAGAAAPTDRWARGPKAPGRNSPLPSKFEIHLDWTAATGLEIDEVQITKWLTDARVPVPGSILVKRTPPNSEDVNDEQVSNLINFHLVHSLVTETETFIDEKRLRGGVIHSVATLDDVATVAKALAEEVAKNSLTRFNQPVRVEEQYQLAFSVHSSLWVAFQRPLEAALQEAKASQVSASFPFKSEFKIVVSLKSQRLPALRIVKRKIDQILAVKYFTHANKKLLASRYGRAQLRALNQTHLFLVDYRTGEIRIFGTPDQRATTEAALVALVEQLEAMKLDEAFTIRFQFRATIKDEWMGKLKATEGLVDLQLMGSRLLASGSTAAIATLSKAISHMLVAQRALTTGAAAAAAATDGCGSCDDPNNCFVFTSCNHKICGDCSEGFMASIVEPVACPFCRVPLVIQDILHLGSSGGTNTLDKWKEYAIQAFLRDHSKQYTKCLTPGCQQIHLVPTPDEKMELVAGGAVIQCDECLAEYCHRCSGALGEVTDIHPTLTCPKNQLRSSSTIASFLKFIQNNIFPLRCPKCEMVFADWSGCCAVTCEFCKQAFCGLCLEDCGTNAHPHVKACKYNTQPGGYFLSKEEIENAHKLLISAKLKAYIQTNVPASLRADLLEALARDLADLKITFSLE